MTLLRDYKLFKFEAHYTYMHRNEDCDGTVTMRPRFAHQSVAIIAKSRVLAEAYVRDKYDKEHHKEFSMRLMEEHAAPHVLWEVPY